MRLFAVCLRSAIALCLLFPAVHSFAQSTPPFSFTSDPRDTLGRQLESEQRQMLDPALGRVPYERLSEERERILSKKQNEVSAPQSAIPGMTWQERGPSNAGGRTRAVLFDPNDPTSKKVWVGSPSGGLWYTNDITAYYATWVPVSDDWENTVVTALAADPSNPQIMYAATGDYYRSAAGGGIWKTTNGGTTWNRLSGTIPGTSYGSLANSFSYIQRLVVNKSGQLFAATYYGVVRSIDGGGSWQFALAPNQAIGISGIPTTDYWRDLVSDLEIGTDGTLYAAFSPSRVFKATNAVGTAWAEITPSGVPSGGERTELALASSSSGSGQVLYAISRAYNSASYNQDIRWFRKSNDAGASWSSLPVPTYNSGEHFTYGNGYYALNLLVDPANNNILYAGGYGGAWFRSINGGLSWSAPLDTYTYTHQNGLAFQPGNSANIVLINEMGVSWATNWGNASMSTSPTILYRNAGYRIGNVSSASMKPAPGGNYLLGAMYGKGASSITSAGLGEGSQLLNSFDNAARTIIDSNEPSLQLFSNYGTWYRVIDNQATYLFGMNCWYDTNPTAYDSENNILYTPDDCGNYRSIRRTTGLGGTTGYTRFTINEYPYSMQLGSDRTNLYVGSVGTLVKYSNLSQTVPTATTIAGNYTFPQNSPISSIDVGATDNELLVTLTYFGISSVWYTNNGGASWINKDPTGSGLPDVPVRTGLFNPKNRKQVILGTDLGVWTTDDISAANPNWTLSSSGIGLRRINELRYRASDGRLIAATAGRGIFETNALGVPYAPSSILITGVSNRTLCAGSTVAVSFTTTGPAFVGTNKYELWVSDSSGNFARQRLLGTGTSSPIAVVLPTGNGALRYGTGFRLRVVAVDAELVSPVSDPLSIGNLGTVSITDRRLTPWYSISSANICPGDQARLTAAVSSGPVESYQWLQNGTELPEATLATYLAGQAGNYQVQVKQAGCTRQSTAYGLYVYNSLGSSVISRFGSQPQCDDTPITLISSYVGEQGTIQWTRNGTVLAGATSATYVAAISGNYAVRVTRDGCEVYPYALSVSLGRSLLAKVDKPSGADSILCLGAIPGDVGLYVNSISPDMLGADAYSVTWYRNGVPISPLQNQFYLGVTQPGSYSFELRQGSCLARSNAVVVRQQATVLPSISMYNIAKSACPGDSRTLYSFEYFPTRQWQRDGIDIPNATGASYTAQTSGAYTIRVAKGLCSGTSAPVSLTFSNAIVPEINSQVIGESCINKYLDVSRYDQLSGTRFQWFKNNVPIAGATEASLNTTTTGLYSVSVTNGACTGLSKPVLSTPYTGTKPVISGAGATCPNATVRLSASHLLSSTIQWKRNGVNIPDQVSTSYYPTQSGSYSVYTSGYCGTFESDPVEVKIGEPTSAALTGSALVSVGQTAQLPVTFTGPAPWSFTLSNGQSVSAILTNPYTLVVAPTATTTYSITNLLNACGTGTSSGQAVVTVGKGQADLSMMAQVNNRVPRLGEVVSYSVLVTNMGPQNAENLRVTSRLPTGLSFAGATSPDVNFADGTVSCMVPSLLAGYTATLVYQLRIEQPGAFFVAAQLAATDTPDPDSQPNSGTGDGQDDAVTVDFQTADAMGALVTSPNLNQTPLPAVQSNQPAKDPNSVELSLDLLSSTQVPQPGDVISLSLIVSNRGGATANNTAVQFELPAGWQPINNISGFEINGQTIRTYFNPIAANSRNTRVIDVQVQAGSGPVKAQILSVTEPAANSIPGNGYQNGERDEASLTLRVR